MARPRRTRRKARRFDEPTPGELATRHRDGAKLLALLAFLALPFGWGVRLTFEPDIEDVRTAASWPTARGVVVESYVEAPHRVDSDGNAIVRYRHRVGGSNYVASGHRTDIACQDEDPYEVVKR